MSARLLRRLPRLPLVPDSAVSTWCPVAEPGAAQRFKTLKEMEELGELLDCCVFQAVCPAGCGEVRVLAAEEVAPTACPLCSGVLSEEPFLLGHGRTRRKLPYAKSWWTSDRVFDGERSVNKRLGSMRRAVKLRLPGRRRDAKASL
jgi:hypothetical protein